MKKPLKSYFNKFFFITLLLFFSVTVVAEDLNYSEKNLRKVFPNYDKIKEIKIEDNVSKEKNNNVLLVVFEKKKLLGFARSVNTTTGCNSECLPVVYTTFFNGDGNYIKLISPPGLTKIFHAEFTAEDYSKLDLLLAMAPKIFDQVNHPKEMTDAISGETLKEYKDSVIEGAAYSTLRIHLYHQETIKHIKNYLKQKN